MFLIFCCMLQAWLGYLVMGEAGWKAEKRIHFNREINDVAFKV